MNHSLRFQRIFLSHVRQFVAASCLVSILLGGFSDWCEAAAQPLTVDFQKLDATHDIDLPVWGPYSKKYAGFSHIPDTKAGLRFDVSVIPGYYRSRVLIPNVLFESGYYPWEVDHDLKRITYRYELEWKDKVFVDVTYSILDANTTMVNMRCVNNAALPQNLSLDLMASLEYPENFPTRRANFPPDARWINAIDYSELTFAHSRPTDNLVYDGWRRGEARSSDYLGGSAVAKGFGRDAGDQVEYRFPMPAGLPEGEVTLVYRLKENSQIALAVGGLANQKLQLAGTGKFEFVSIPFSGHAPGEARLAFKSEGGDALELNGFFISPKDSARKLTLIPIVKDWTPEIKQSGSRDLVLKYKDVQNYYGIAWNFPRSAVKEFLNDDLDIFFRKSAPDVVSKKFMGNQLGHFTDVSMRPIELKPNSEQIVQAVVCTGPLAEVQSRLAAFCDFPNRPATPGPEEDPFANVLPEGRKYVLGQKLMRAATLANVSYPIYTQQSYIRHFTPGKWWNSLYTWDDGFIALGLAEINPDLAVQCLNTYTTSAGSQSAFIHHGSLVPVQVYAFFDLWSKTQSPELVRYFYPRLKRYYEFLAGRTGGSSTRILHSNLLKPWDYFYNSGGWDDYPAQKAVHEQHLEKSIAPVITTAQCIRVAKLLRMAAEELSLKEDLAAYDQDIRIFSDALQKYSWNAGSGYFSYVVHDENGNPTGHFKDSQSDRDFNMGLDGAYPLMSGICTPEQQRILLEKIFSATNMWTPSGICVVDQSAPYFRNDGYWNGAVWMPHQWFFWKAMLDLGRPDLAAKIAGKGLQVWKTETDESYHTFEHFLVDTGRGAGWHQFSGLSTPVLSWFAAYYVPGTATTGFEVLIKQQSFDPGASGYEATLAFDKTTPPHPRSMLVCLNPASNYVASFNGERLELNSPCRGMVEIELPPTNVEGKIIIKPVAKLIGLGETLPGK